MYAINEGLKKINGEYVDTYSREVTDGLTSLTAEAGTTGYSGSPARGAGGRTYLCLKADKGDFLFDPVFDKEGKTVGIEVAACGDAGLNALMKALAFIEQALNDLRCEVDD